MWISKTYYHTEIGSKAHEKLVCVKATWVTPYNMGSLVVLNIHNNKKIDINRLHMFIISLVMVYSRLSIANASF